MPGQRPWEVDRQAGSPLERFRSYTTRAYAVVYRFGGDPLHILGNVQGVSLRGPGSVVSVSYTKSKGGPSGSFSITVRPGKDFDFENEIHVGDWISFWWERNGQKFHGSLGNIDDVQRTRRVIEGATVETWTIKARDIGKVFETAEIWFNEYIDTEVNVGGKVFGERLNFTPAGSPDRVIESLIDGFLGAAPGNLTPWSWPGGLDRRGPGFIDSVMMEVQSTAARRARFFVGDDPTRKASLRGYLLDSLSLFEPSPGTRLLDMLNEWLNPTLNEMFFDVVHDDDKASPVETPMPLVVCRELPFINKFDGSSSPWFNLPTVYLKPYEVDDLDVARSDLERVNAIMVYSAGIGSVNMEQFAIYKPALDEESIRRHGMRKLERQTRFAGVGSVGDDPGRTWAAEIGDWMTLLIGWYSLNHEWYSGSVTTKFLLGEARIGQRLVIEGDPFQAYIEGVSHSWSYPNMGRTTLSITRGFRGDGAAVTTKITDQLSKWRGEAPLQLEAPFITRGTQVEE